MTTNKSKQSIYFDRIQSKAVINLQNLASEIGYTLIDPYKGAKVKIAMVCDHGHNISMTPTNLKSGKRCGSCCKNDPQKAKQSFYNALSLCGYSTMEQYKSAREKIKIKCDKDHVYSVTPDNFKRGKRCPFCTRKGFNPIRQGSIYLYRWTCPDTNKSFLKFGITNCKDHTKRIKAQQEKTKYKPSLIKCCFYDRGSIVWDLELEIKRSLQTGFIDRGVFGDGFSETTADTPQNEKLIIDIMQKGII